MKAVALVFAVLTCGSLLAEVKPLAEPWLKKGETLVCFGDSLTHIKTSYIKYLTEKLEAKGIKVVNAGLGGDKTPMALTRIRDVAALKPDAVMFFFGANDSVIGRGRWRDEPTVDPITYRDNLIWMVHYFRLETQVRKFSIVAPTCVFEGEQSRAFGPVYAEYRLKAREAADRTDAVLIPLDEEMAQIQKANPQVPMTRDGVHLSDVGARHAADIMLRSWHLDAD